MEKYIKRIDELGKISLPKVIIDKYNLHSGSSIEITIKNNIIVLRDYSPLKRYKYIIYDIASSLSKALEHNVVITDLNSILYSSEKEMGFISDQLKKSIFRRENILETHPKNLVIGKEKKTTPYIINSIISHGDIVGLLIIYSDKVDLIDYKISKEVSKFIGKYIEQ
ncbi:MAG: hypothetical protein MRZ34_01190 [Bacillales bacterium]|nr:hypothetical protein [Bacillales bacterium]